LWTHPGVFSWDRIDVGSALLLKHLPALSGRGADLGAGIGVLALQVLKSPKVSELTLVDIDRRAITSAQKNISDARAQFVWADVRTLALQKLDFVVMNPPFHEVGIEDRTLGQAFITCAAAMLKKGGQCWLTANTHMPYEALLAQHFVRVVLVDTADGFKIYRAET
ncbi:MAG: class I SAM-dependent methyltransferase, partial [Rickettsiales bacterium]